MIDRQTVERIKEAADIVDVVSEFVTLKKVGANYRGLCPFHNDHSPSFYVSPSRRTCHCFVCQEGGDSVGFLMKHEQLTYPDALRWLANRYHIDISEEEMTDEQRRQQSERESLFVINEWAAGYFHDILLNDIDGRAIGMQYFRQRGIRDDIVERFRLGFCLADRQAMSDAALAKGFNADYMVKTGLCFRKDNDGKSAPRKGDSGLVDRFAGRVIFPWFGVSGKVVAFGGRVLDQRTKGVNQKYVNSPDSDIYHKDHELYGIFQAKKAIAKENCVYMVEGYTDVLSMHQCGIENVVANSGTALSEHQINILFRFTPNIILLYDGDAAGIKAALRGTDMLLRKGMNVKVLLLPDGDDPDSFARKHTAEEFRTYIEEHKADFIEFKTKVLLDGVKDTRERSAAVTSIVESISMIEDQIVRAAYIQDCSMRLGFSEQIITGKVNEFIRNRLHQEAIERQRGSNRPVQDYHPTGQQPGQPPLVQGNTPSHRGNAPSSQTGAPLTSGKMQQTPATGDGNASNVDPRYADIPEEAFLPPEAFDNAGGAVAGGYPAGNQYGGETPLPYETGLKPTNGGGLPQRQPKETASDMLMKIIIQHGADKVFPVELENGEVVYAAVAQYVAEDLASDNLQFGNPLYNKILEEANEHAYDEDFDCERYFTMHADYDVSSLSIRLTSDSVMLAKSMEVKVTEDSLRSKVEHLVYDIRQEFIVSRLKQLQTDILLADNEPERQMQLMMELQEMQKLRNLIAKRIGGNLMVK